MKNSIRFLLILMCLLPKCKLTAEPQVYEANNLTLAQKGKSSFRIVIPAGAANLQKHSATQLQQFLKQISGVKLPIVTDDPPLTGHEIILGDNRHLRQLNTGIDLAKLGSEGFTIRTLDNHLLIVGGTDRGTLYGVYTFLEEYLGCRWYSSRISRIPYRSTIKLPAIDDTQVPALDYREVYYADPMDSDFAARVKLNGNASTMKDNKMIAERHAGWATWCHTAFTFVPPDKYFKDHPEYYSFTGGKRQARQLCLTNPEVFDITVSRVKELMKRPQDFISGSGTLQSRKKGPIWADTEDRYWDVSQMDWHGYCECENCQAIDEREGTPIGSVLTFINRLADRFPNKIISTLSYQYTRRPPKTIRPAKNVSIMLCNIECTRGVPIVTSPFSQDISFRSDIQNWSKICNNLFIWDYVVNFAHLFTPHPNLRIQQPNIKLFIDHNAGGIFCQGSREVGGEFCELRTYLLAKLLWNPDCDVDNVINDFLHGYYGPAAGPIRRYIDLMHDTVEQTGERVGMNDHPNSHRNGFLSPQLFEQYGKLFDEAEKLTAKDSDLLFRVRTARMPLMYAGLEMQIGEPAGRLEILEKFFDLAKRNGIRRLSEWGNSPQQFREKHRKNLLKELDHGK